MLMQRIYVLSQLFLTFQCAQILSTTSLVRANNYSTKCYESVLGKCNCNNDININCQLHDDTVNIDYRNSTIVMACSQKRSNINLLDQVPNLRLNNVVDFQLRNCFQFPDILTRENIVYNGVVAYDGSAPPQNFFGLSKGMQKLYLLLVNANTLNAQIFRNLAALKILGVLVQMPSGAYFSLPEEIFHTLPKLESLQFRTARPTEEDPRAMQNLTSYYFRNLRALKHLDLTDSKLGILADNLFETLTELSYLNLQRNELKSLPRNLLATQHKLAALFLNNNFLKYLPLGIFDKTTMLWKLDLSHNQLSNPSNIIENVKPLQNLYYLNLEHNQLESVMGYGSHANETILSIFSNKNASRAQFLVENIKDIFKLPSAEIMRVKLNFTVIRLGYNRLTHFNMDWLSEANLNCPFAIDLQYNLIEHVYALSPRLFNSTATCGEQVSLEENPIACDCKSAWLHNTTSMSAVYFSGCVEEAVAYCAWQPVLCPTNCICSIGAAALHINCTAAALETIVQLPRPEQYSLDYNTLSISHNHFRALPSNTILGYANVTQLNASNNEITDLLPSQLPQNLTVLDLRNNRLVGLSADLLSVCFSENQMLQQLYLGQNPWKCDCSAEKLLRAVRAYRVRIPDVEQLFCDNDENRRLLDVDDVCTSEKVAA